MISSSELIWMLLLGIDKHEVCEMVNICMMMYWHELHECVV